MRIDQKAQARGEAALDVIDEIMSDPFAENKDRLAAAREMLDRGHGKPNQAVIMVPLDRQRRQAAALYSDAELGEIIEGEIVSREQAEQLALPAPERDPLLE
jgi:hypothetical protein